MKLSATFRNGVLPLALSICVSTLAWSPAGAQTCAGDCNNDGEVIVAELMMGVNIALGEARATVCSAIDTSEDARVSVAELISAVRSALEGCPINVRAKTFRSVQQVFDQSCAFSTCHSALARQGGLVLNSEEVSYTNLVDTDAQHPEAAAMGMKRVVSGDPASSFLIRKLRGMGPGDSMPQASPMLSEEIIQVIEDWIARGAHETLEECEALGEEEGFQGGGAHGTGAQTVCDSTPIEPGDFKWVPEQALPVPALDEGIQLYVPPRPVEAASEWETCYAFRPDWLEAGRNMGIAGNPTIKWQEYRMHEGSHHLLVYSYFGQHPDWVWPEGFFDCSAGNCVHPGICTEGTCTSGKIGQDCSENGDCDECPPDGRTIIPIGGTQVAGTRYQVLYPEGVGIPVLGKDAVIIANLHYTNPFQPAQDIYAEAWINFYFHQPGEFKALLDGVFAIGYTDLLVEPFESRSMSMIWRPRGIISGSDDAFVFNLFGHMHKRGKLFQVDLISGGSCSVSGDLCATDADCACRPASRNCTEGQTCVLSDDYEDTTIYSTTTWDSAPVIEYPKPYLKVPKDAGLRWTCHHINGIEGDPNYPPKVCHEGCRACGWDDETRTCVFTRGRNLGFHEATRTYQEGDPMPLVFGELADDDMCNLFGYFIPGSAIGRLE